MKFLFLLLLVPQLAMASALVVRDDFNKILNVIAVFNFEGSAATEKNAEMVTNNIDSRLNGAMLEVTIAGEIYSVLFNLDYQISKTKYAWDDSCAHNTIMLRQRLSAGDISHYLKAGSRNGVFINDEDTTSMMIAFLVGLGTKDLNQIPLSTLSFNNGLSCLGAGSPIEI